MKSYAFFIALLALTATPSLADDMPAPVNADGVAWGPAPPILPKGAQIAVLSGDPSKDGLYVLRLRCRRTIRFRPTIIRRQNT